MHRHATSAAATNAARRVAVQPNVTEQWLLQPGMYREGLGAWGSKKRPDALQRAVMKSVCNTYPSPFKLYPWGIRPSPVCTCSPPGTEFCCTQSHIQCKCEGTKEARIKAHHTLRKIVSMAVRKHCRRWTSYPETTLGVLLDTLGEEEGRALPVLLLFEHLNPDSGELETVEWLVSSTWRPNEWDTIERMVSLFKQGAPPRCKVPRLRPTRCPPHTSRWMRVMLSHLPCAEDDCTGGCQTAYVGG